MTAVPIVTVAATPIAAVPAKPSARPRARRAASSASGRPERVTDAPGYVLHATPYKETSLVLQAFTRDHGRVALVAKGARRPHSALRTVLVSMQPLMLSWSGRGEVKTLTGATWVGGQPALREAALLCGFYMNELLLKLLAREDAHPFLFAGYLLALNELAAGLPQDAVLRRFELLLLREIGYGPRMDRTAADTPVEPERRYLLMPGVGVREARRGDHADHVVVDGKTLLDIEAGDYSDPRTRQQAKILMRQMLAAVLAGRPLNSRQILTELQSL
ncbi:DNA repair protein RecO [Derxia gummosa]|uniref:DNA repair protein RecO n=1 Tax=Derxia gummosa DSM 723 TaxID=1121388 RepID=A0A9U5H0B9_9BURK|nr:DNA repair protein RecO [Derxia gummosa]